MDESLRLMEGAYNEEHVLNALSAQAISGRQENNQSGASKVLEMIASGIRPVGGDGASADQALEVLRKKAHSVNPQERRIITPEEYNRGAGRRFGGVYAGEGAENRYPLIDFNRIEEIPETIGHYIAYKSLEKFYEKFKLDDFARKGIIQSLMSGFVKASILFHEKEFITEFQEGLPLIHVWYDFAHGASTIGRLYTVELNGYEFPVHLIGRDVKAPQEPSDELINQHIKYTVLEGKIPEAVKSGIQDALYKPWSAFAAKEITNFEYDNKNVLDPSLFNMLFVHDDIWLMHQRGKMTERDFKLDNGKTVKVRCYERPDSFTTWFNNFALDHSYTLIDVPMDRLEKLIQDYTTPFYSQQFFEEQFRIIRRVKDSFLRRDRLPLIIDDKYLLPEVRDSIARDYSATGTYSTAAKTAAAGKLSGLGGYSPFSLSPYSRN